jgi:hypothetical protein
MHKSAVQEVLRQAGLGSEACRPLFYTRKLNGARQEPISPNRLHGIRAKERPSPVSQSVGTRQHRVLHFVVSGGFRFPGVDRLVVEAKAFFICAKQMRRGSELYRGIFWLGIAFHSKRGVFNKRNNSDTKSWRFLSWLSVTFASKRKWRSNGSR